MKEFLSGVATTLCLVAALFFLRFWRQTHDRLFAFFAVAFVIMSANWAALAFLPVEDEARTVVYGVRILAFVLILVAVIDKNRSER
jgi:uncharacterized membrane protein